MTEPDIEIIEQVLGGNIPAFAEIIDRYQQRVYSLCVRILRNPEDAEEAASDAFLKAYKALETFRRDSEFPTWLFRIAYNSAISRLRQRRSKPEAQAPELSDREQFEERLYEINSALGRIADKERREIIRKALEQLGPQEAAIVSLYYFEDNSVAEISGITGLSKSNVKIKLFRARLTMGNYLSKILKNELRYI
ncbi:MAG: RNA polymerase sigma factor [Bacteroidota bacterium]